jgi:Cu2+-exporting ATPase
MPDAPAQTDVIEVSGRGLKSGDIKLGARSWVGEGDDSSTEPELWLAAPGKPSHRFAFTETLRPDAAATVAWLLQYGYRVSLLSGDRAAAVKDIARRCCITESFAGLDPVAKTRWISERKSRGEAVMMIGDGLNDAPALASADVSMSPSGAADIAQNAADVIFQGDSLTAVREVLSVARKARRVIVENLSFSVLYNFCAVPLAMAGFVTPPMAAALMSSSSIIVVLNAMRLTRGARKGNAP